MPRRRFWPEAGTNSVSAMACRAISRRVWLPLARRDPPPPCGEGLGVGGATTQTFWIPPPRPSPTRGRGRGRAVGDASGLSMAMNHCGVLRKMTGFLERQECGYWCLRRPRAISAPAFDQRLDDGVVGVALVALVVDDALALEARRLLGEAPVAVDGEGDGRCRCRAAVSFGAFAIQMSKSSRPWPGAVCTKPVPSSSVT